MNYFAHGLNHLHDPYMLAGTAVPDWLGVVDRRVRIRARHAEEFLRHANGADDAAVALARGIVAHHRDDDWFHRSRAFAELQWQLTAQVRDALPADESFRPSFVGHVLVEVLLDAALIEDDLPRAEAYYQALDQIDSGIVEATVNRMARRPTQRLAPLVDGFRRARFLFDYLDDGKLLYRLNQVMARVNLARLPESLSEIFAAARQSVRRRRAELLALATFCK